MPISIVLKRIFLPKSLIEKKEPAIFLHNVSDSERTYSEGKLQYNELERDFFNTRKVIVATTLSGTLLILLLIFKFPFSVLRLPVWY